MPKSPPLCSSPWPCAPERQKQRLEHLTNNRLNKCRFKPCGAGLSRSVVSSLRPCQLEPTRLLVYGILQARILEWVAMSSSRGSPQPRDLTQVSWTAGRFFTSWVMCRHESQHVAPSASLELDWSCCYPRWKVVHLGQTTSEWWGLDSIQSWQDLPTCFEPPHSSFTANKGLYSQSYGLSSNHV